MTTSTLNKENNMTTTYATAFKTPGFTIPPHLEAQAEIPLVSRLVAQGDLYIARVEYDFHIEGKTYDISTSYQVVRGEAERNTHALIGSGSFTECNPIHSLLDYGVLRVGPGQEAILIHSGEHGAVRMTEGTYRIWGQLSYEAELRRTAD